MGEDMTGPIIFASRVLAHSYARLRNKYHRPDDSNNWKAIPLQEFDLLAHAHGVDGPLHCMLTLGLSMATPTAVVCKGGAPRIRCVPLSYDIPKGLGDITFSFNQWVFDFMREEWASLGLHNYEKELEATDELSDTDFERLMQAAIARLDVCQEPLSSAGLWAVFSTHQEVWVSANEDPDIQRPKQHALH